MTCQAIITRPILPFAKDSGSKPSISPILQTLIYRKFVDWVPTIKLTFCGDCLQVASLTKQSELIVLTSPSAVYFFALHLNQAITDARQRDNLLATKLFILVGKKTRQALVEQFRVPLQSVTPPADQEQADFLAKILSQQIALWQAKQQARSQICSVAYFRSAKGKPLKLLAASQAGTIQDLVIYQNEDALENREILSQRMGVATDWFFFSPSAITSLLAMTEAQVNQQPWSAWCIGRVTQMEAEKHGFTTIHVASLSREETLLQEYCQWHNITL